MEIAREENPQSSDISIGERHQPSENAVPVQEEHEFKEAEATFTISDEEIKAVMEPIAATGKFWCEWEELKNILSFRLKQILLAPRALYPKLSKLALALEKNLLVTSTLTRSTEPLAVAKSEAEPESTNDRLNKASELATNNEDTEMVDAVTEVEGSIVDEAKQAEAPKDQGGSDSSENHA